ncbi:hypothetical protein G6F60_013333 [Rhizopus arrhizus]|nr:hypothetical protein G6F60_013333 [Rhizopus arrhizus]
MARHLASVYDGHLLPSVRPPAPPDPSSLGLPFGPPGSSPLVVSSGAAAQIHTSTAHSNHFNTSIFSPATLASLIGQLPTRKAPGADHIKAEMLKPISTDLSFLLSWFFTLCWQWSYVPSLWRHAQVQWLTKLYKCFAFFASVGFIDTKTIDKLQHVIHHSKV